MDRYKIIDNVGVYFITFTVVDWLPVFVDESPNSILIDSLKYCIDNKGLRVNAYVIMPNHLHAVVFNTEFDSTALHQALTDFRKFTGQALTGYVNTRFWQSGWHAEGIESERFLEQKVNYIHDNPCRKGLVRLPQDWRYSSAAFWMDGESVDLPIASLDWEN